MFFGSVPRPSNPPAAASIIWAAGFVKDCLPEKSLGVSLCKHKCLSDQICCCQLLAWYSRTQSVEQNDLPSLEKREAPRDSPQCTHASHRTHASLAAAENRASAARARRSRSAAAPPPALPTAVWCATAGGVAAAGLVAMSAASAAASAARVDRQSSCRPRGEQAEWRQARPGWTHTPRLGQTVMPSRRRDRHSADTHSLIVSVETPTKGIGGRGGQQNDSLADG